MKRSSVVALLAGGAVAVGVMAYAENRRCQPGPNGEPSQCTGNSSSSGYHGSGGGSSSYNSTTRGGFGYSGGIHGFFGG